MTVAIVIGIFFGLSLIVWLSGYYFSSDSSLRWIPTIVVLASLFLLLLLIFFVKPDIGKVDVLIKKGIVSDIKQLQLEIPIDLINYIQKDGYIILSDSKNREYTVNLPNNNTGILKNLKIHTSKHFLYSIKYIVVEVNKKKYIVIT